MKLWLKLTLGVFLALIAMSVISYLAITSTPSDGSTSGSEESQSTVEVSSASLEEREAGDGTEVGQSTSETSNSETIKDEPESGETRQVSWWDEVTYGNKINAALASCYEKAEECGDGIQYKEDSYKSLCNTIASSYITQTYYLKEGSEEYEDVVQRGADALLSYEGRMC